MARPATLATATTGTSASMIFAFAQSPSLIFLTFVAVLTIIGSVIMTAARSPKKYRRDAAYRVLLLLAETVRPRQHNGAVRARPDRDTTR